ncbi:hypothetical protein MGYG_07352 [Nannizzia gypsea CBS 118893]|uniref:Lipid droplet-associated hydrolase n=1 Tax=Arthroderma gypseum (strain ATCC MYA-4604 / CBS 118893) TaxID=535722 RepID=E4V2W9_ARTGP|nr:hypothetical protein MGYG_07352 [Nannizzia gypsea CBS 118893]EFR04343.1 hypothetical protein MGYG_07352 [Nannizzia gypsea CBS 118893]
MLSPSSSFNLNPHITPNSFLSHVSRAEGGNTSALSPSTTLIYFISGNPGLISYYHLFFSLLSSDLSQSFSHDPGANGSYIIRGRSLGGFEVPEAQSVHVKGEEDTNAKSPKARLYSLDEQISFMERDLEVFVRTWQDAAMQQRKLDERPRANVIVMGHSVGAYMAMEIMRRRREKAGLQRRVDGVVPQSTGANGGGDELGLDIIGGILLFPTVVDIAKSPNGRVLTKLLYIPSLPLLVSLFARFLVLILPELVLYSIVSRFMRNPRKEAVETTVSMLKNAHIVRQALHMAADEMKDISADKWNDEIWGFSSPTHAPKDRLTKMVFYFGRNDHWVAEATRKDIIQSKSRAEQDGSGPVLKVCEDGVAHGFCIGHNEIMAKKVGQFIRDIVQESGLDS